MTTGKKLRAWRIEAGLSQEEAASKIGTAQRTWGQWECDETTPEVDYAVDIQQMTNGAVTVLDLARDRRRRRKQSRARRAKAAAPAAPSSSTNLVDDIEHRSAS
jgi:transcriptional regulator with XRE-family HTH domain